ncbi:MAG TPA: hypothetical protein P5551_04490 [Syntrophales bacterium]|jgi:hypothetical protein|nr:hypothetical protein [Syntrophales bacterium]HRT61606.1 hypothetical protein [Syntrophales bacterium]
MNGPQFFDHIRIPAPLRNIYRRLGYKKGVTHLEAGQRDRLDRWIRDAGLLIHLKGAARRLPLIGRDSSKTRLPEDVVFQSRDLAAFLAGCSEIAVIAATAGEDIVAEIGKAAGEDQMTRGVVFDAVASETVDAALDWVTAYLRQTLRRENKESRKGRFSAGYGDFALQNQKRIYELLELHRLGVRINRSFVLIPEKSVTAVLGIRSIP